MRALSKLIFGGDHFFDSDTDESITPEPAILEVGMSEADFSNRNLGAGGAIIIAAWITHKDRGGLSVLSLKENRLATKEGGKALAQALANNSTLKELDVSSNVWKERGRDKGDGPGFVQELAVGLIDNGAISSVNVLGNKIGIAQAQVLAAILKEHPALKSLCGHRGDETELNMSGKKIGVEGAIILAPEIVDNGVLSVANVMGNKIGKKQLVKLEDIMRFKPNLVSLCGIADDATEADLSGLVMDAGDAATLASELPDKGAMTALNLASTNLRAEGAKIVAEAIKVTMCGHAAILAPFSRPSDFSINCCCLLLSTGYGGDDEPESCSE
jgi:hypothetical protein